ncbi:MAG: PadR family transcriptional regulator [Candidatus Thermoplasmatota archaeon]
MNEIEKFRNKLSKELKSGVDSLLILCAIASKRGPIHGYQIIRTIEKWSNGKIVLKDATVYPFLKYIRQRKLVIGYWAESPEGPPRYYYELTDKGRKALEIGLKEWDDLVNDTNKIISNLEVMAI